jgi:TATA-box binding protein (TBP) (component of TFIID and TFIIIB)
VLKNLILGDHLRTCVAIMNATRFSPTPYKVSTITATGSIGTHLDLHALFDRLQVGCEPFHDAKPQVIYMEYGHKRAETHTKGTHHKKSRNPAAGGGRRRAATAATAATSDLLNVGDHHHAAPSAPASEEETKQTAAVAPRRFDNQATLIIRMPLLQGTAMTGVSHVNMKVFRNGNIQMTGLKYIEQGILAIDTLMEQLRTMSPPAVERIDEMKNLAYQIRLINCDFRVGFEIKRDRLHKILQEHYDVYSSYEPCIYPGVKIQYCWNRHPDWTDAHLPMEARGTCRCSRPCSGKGTGCGDGDCKKITIAVFQSGCIIITGAQSHAQIETAYDFICHVLTKHLDTLVKPPLALPTTTTTATAST